MNLEHYRTLVFDCDGVILNSNAVKTEAFRRVALPFGQEAANALVEYHVANGGVSRYEKFRHFIENILSSMESRPAVADLLAHFSSEVRRGLLGCEVAQGLDALRESRKHTRWLVVSGGDQLELREIFDKRGLAQYFDGGIYGSPDSKEVILAREIVLGNISRPALFLGDSIYDHRSATGAGLDFRFVADWTEVPNWREYVAANGITAIRNIAQMV